MKEYSYFDSHVHIKDDKKHKELMDISVFDETLKERGLDGCLATIHSHPRFYEKDFSKLKNYCKNYSNIIPCVEITQPFKFNNISIDCHIMYLGEIPLQDLAYGSWFCHVEKKGGLFFQYNKKNLSVKKALCNDEVKIVESTTDLFHACFLKALNLTVLLGTDVHPKGMFTSYLGSKGTLIESDTFNYTNFMEGLKNNTFGYFSKAGKNYFQCLPKNFKENKITITKF